MQEVIQQTIIPFDQGLLNDLMNREPGFGNFHELTLDKASAEILRKTLKANNGFCDILCNQITNSITSQGNIDNIIKEFLLIKESRNKMAEKLVPYEKTHVLKINDFRRFIALLACICFRFYPDSPLSVLDQWSLNSKSEQKKDNAINKALSEMENGACYKLCTIKRKYGILPSSGHSMLIYKDSKGTFTFFNPNVGWIKNITQKDVLEIIKLHANSSEITLMDNKKFLENNHKDLIQNAVANLEQRNNQPQAHLEPQPQDLQSETLWQEFCKEITKKIAIDAGVDINQVEKINTNIGVNLKNLQTLFENKDKTQILDQIQLQLIQANKTEAQEILSHDQITFIHNFITFCKNNSLIEARDMQETLANHPDIITYNTTKEDVKNFINNTDKSSILYKYGVALIESIDRDINRKTNDINKMLTQQKSWFTKYLKDTKGLVVKDL